MTALYYLPPVTHLLPLTMIRRERRLPVPGVIIARVNERVQASDVVAEAEVSPRHYFLDIARGLGVAESDVTRHLTRERNERIEAGEVIAGPVGIARRTVRAPANGRIVALSGGKILFEVRGEPLTLEAGFPGNVVSTDGSTSVVIETTGALLQAKWGNGRQDYGVMRLVGEGRNARLEGALLDIDVRGAIVVAGMCDHPAPLAQARDLAIRGLILGGLTSDLIPVARRLNYPVLVLEGFGRLQLNRATYDLLKSNEGREVAIDGRMLGEFDGQRPELIIPLPSNRVIDLPDEVIPLTQGIRVRVVRKPYFGQVGTMQEILEHAEAFPSGLRARSARVSLEAGGTVDVPLANLEILQ